MTATPPRRRYATATARRLATRAHILLVFAAAAAVFTGVAVAAGGLAALTGALLYLPGAAIFLAGTALALLWSAAAVDTRTVTACDVRSSGCRADNPTNPEPERTAPAPRQGDNPTTRQAASPTVSTGGTS